MGRKVAVIGGGLAGCEIAYELYLQGKEPVIVEMQEDLIAAKGICLANSSFLRDFFRANKAPVYLRTRLKEIGTDGITVVGAEGGESKLNVDFVILSVGCKPAPLAPKGKNVFVIGDGDRVGDLRSVIW